MDFGKVAVMMGGQSAERDVSLKSGAAVLAALRSVEVDAHPFDPKAKPLESLHAEGFSRVFIALHGRGGEDGAMQGALDLLAIPYTGSGVLASALAMDKWRSKLVWRSVGLPVPEFELLTPESDFAAIEARLGLPLFVKPANEGSSIGISKVSQPGQLRAAFELAARYDSCVLAERFLSGGEFTVGLLNGRALPAIRIVPATDFYDYEAKYLRDDTEYRIPCGLDSLREREMSELAQRAYAVLGGRAWGRMDMMLDAEGKIYCLEANTAPGMTDHSLVPMAAKAAGISFTQLVVKLLEEAHCG
ncbi:MAG TPA: D-alanine--D-alanine ligase [Rhodocyclaceae bacterium]|nr:D-alanine--D-alanine ligase [Rhodocyclaceae bacterium]